MNFIDPPYRQSPAIPSPKHVIHCFMVQILLDNPHFQLKNNHILLHFLSNSFVSEKFHIQAKKDNIRLQDKVKYINMLCVLLNVSTLRQLPCRGRKLLSIPQDMMGRIRVFRIWSAHHFSHNQNCLSQHSNHLIFLIHILQNIT